MNFSYAGSAPLPHVIDVHEVFANMDAHDRSEYNAEFYPTRGHIVLFLTQRVGLGVQQHVLIKSDCIRARGAFSESSLKWLIELGASVAIPEHEEEIAAGTQVDWVRACKRIDISETPMALLYQRVPGAYGPRYLAGVHLTSFLIAIDPAQPVLVSWSGYIRTYGTSTQDQAAHMVNAARDLVTAHLVCDSNN